MRPKQTSIIYLIYFIRIISQVKQRLKPIIYKIKNSINIYNKSYIWSIMYIFNTLVCMYELTGLFLYEKDFI